MSNIFNEPDSTVKICDFGIQDITDQMCLHLKKVQKNPQEQSPNENDTPVYYKDGLHYRAPEVVTKDKYLYKSDIWSLGCCVIEMITGKKPWYGYISSEEHLKKKFRKGSNIFVTNLLLINHRNTTYSNRCKYGVQGFH